MDQSDASTVADGKVDTETPWVDTVLQWLTPRLQQHAESLMLLLLLILGFWTRFYRIAWPPETVFDEVHFASFAHLYLNRSYFFDIHPPLAKLTLAAVAKVLRDVPNRDWYKESSYPPESRYYVMRGCAAFFGALLPAVTYLVARKMRLSRAAAGLAAFFVLFDMLNVIEARHILTDSQLIFYCALTMLAFLYLWEGPPASRQRRWRSVLAGLASGAALSVKWTTLVVPGLFGLESVAASVFLEHPLEWSNCFLVGAVAMMLYVALWYVHFRVLIFSGEGDAFMSDEFQRTLIGNENYDANATKPNFFKLVWQLNAEMYRANKAILDEHEWQSKWITWPYTGRGLLYWNRWQEGSIDADGKVLEPGTAMQIYLLGNPLLFWMTLAVVLLTIVALPFALRWLAHARHRPAARSRIQQHLRVAVFLLLGYALGLLPYAPIARSTFIYHYLPPLLFAELLFAHMVVDGPWVPEVIKPAQLGTLIIVVFWCFWYFRAWVYGHISLSADDHEHMRWLKTKNATGANKGWY
ncbi:hypothetical protein CDCA_CDCA14G3744 [Cyanidium caldarium]|uniref:Dolichyl-phosphate-mannose--protein mannosyltransferase n=1 Tax=Cyanidium caldarium TaxID=2771 RepID=A0AAV9IZN3_CYACA|nr:hypothetical protein CDCA_CDCA14G3744 [Cyanidium caldarium]